MHGAIAVALSILASTSTTANPLPAPEPALRAGFLLGDPISISVTNRLWRQLRLQVEGGYSVRGAEDLVISADVLWDMPSVFGTLTEAGAWVLWAGLGARVALDSRGEAAERIGIRVPFGVSYLVPRSTAEVFVQLAPGLSFTPDKRMTMSIGAGLRIALFD